MTAAEKVAEHDHNKKYVRVELCEERSSNIRATLKTNTAFTIGVLVAQLTVIGLLISLLSKLT